ncbi:MAG: hypothetical protein ACLQBX_18290 [Candidatus Limnocylindrales bacterium]
MGLHAAQYTVTTASAQLCSIPPGPCTVVLTNSNVTAADIVYIGTVGTVTAGTGAPIPSQGSVTLTFPPGNSGATLYAIGVASSVVGVLIANGQ